MSIEELLDLLGNEFISLKRLPTQQGYRWYVNTRTLIPYQKGCETAKEALEQAVEILGEKERLK